MKLLQLLVLIATCTNSKIIFDGRFQNYKNSKEMSSTTKASSKWAMHVFTMRGGPASSPDSIEKDLKIISDPKTVPINDKSVLELSMDSNSVFQPNIHPGEASCSIMRSDLVVSLEDKDIPTSGVIAHFATLNAKKGFKNDKSFRYSLVECI